MSVYFSDTNTRDGKTIIEKFRRIKFILQLYFMKTENAAAFHERKICSMRHIYIYIYIYKFSRNHYSLNFTGKGYLSLFLECIYHTYETYLINVKNSTGLIFQLHHFPKGTLWFVRNASLNMLKARRGDEKSQMSNMLAFKKLSVKF